MNERLFQQTLRRAFWVPFGIALVLGATLTLEVRFLMQQAARVEHSDQVITISQRIYRSRIDQESGLRAYVLTRDTHFLEPFYEGQKQALTLEPELTRLVSDNPEQTERNEKALQAFRAWAAWADKVVAMTAADGDAGNWGVQFRGKELMDEYRRLRTEFLERERELRDQRLARSRRTLRLVNVSIVVLSILFALAFTQLGRKQLTGLSKVYAKALQRADANAALAQSQRDWLHTTLTSIGDAVIATDAQGLVTLMNPVAEKLTGWPLAQAQDKPLTEVFSIVNQETREKVENPVDKVRRLQGVVGLANHTILIGRNGQEIAIDDSGAPIFAPDGSLAGIVLVFRDVTGARQAEAQLVKQAALLDQAWDAIIVREEPGTIKYWNRGAEELYGWSRDEALGRVTHDLLRTQFPEPLPEIVARTRKREPLAGRVSAYLQERRADHGAVPLGSASRQRGFGTGHGDQYRHHPAQAVGGSAAIERAIGACRALIGCHRPRDPQPPRHHRQHSVPAGARRERSAGDPAVDRHGTGGDRARHRDQPEHAQPAS